MTGRKQPIFRKHDRAFEPSGNMLSFGQRERQTFLTVLANQGQPGLGGDAAVPDWTKIPRRCVCRRNHRSGVAQGFPMRSSDSSAGYWSARNRLLPGRRRRPSTA